MVKIARSAARIALIYGFFAALWILFSDLALEAMVPDRELMSRMQTYKGWLFVSVTAGMLFVLVFRALLKIERVNEFDPLTNLLNHHMFTSQLDRKLTHRFDGYQVACLYLDIDHFSELNKSMGFDKSNQVLKSFASKLRGSLSSDLLLARFAPDQFAVAFLFPKDSDVIEQRVRQIKNLFSTTMMEHDLNNTATIGIAIGPEDGADVKSLMSASAAALSKAKSGLRGSVHFYNRALTELEQERHQLVAELRKALNSKTLSVVYQPQFDLESRVISGLEVLIRWNHPSRGYISPDVFVKLAEEHALSDMLSSFVIERANQELSESQLTPNIIPRVSINISALEFNSPALLKNILKQIEAAEALKGRLQIEITETATLTNLANSARTITKLKNRGIRFSIDDFGTGYTSLAMIKDLPVDEIKIDRSFVNELESSGRASAIVQAVIAMTEGFGISCIAEGIEHLSQLNLLRELGCHEGQGYHLATPMKIEALVDFINDLESA